MLDFREITTEEVTAGNSIVRDPIAPGNNEPRQVRQTLSGLLALLHLRILHYLGPLGDIALHYRLEHLRRAVGDVEAL